MHSSESACLNELMSLVYMLAYWSSHKNAQIHIMADAFQAALCHVACDAPESIAHSTIPGQIQVH